MSHFDIHDDREARRIIARIVSVYDGRIIRSYATVRFAILRHRFLKEIGQYLPKRGEVVDVGCGFGLFAIFFAIWRPEIQISGYDLSLKRVEMARLAARRLGVSNATFHHGNAVDLVVDRPVAAAYMLDLVHHIPRPAVAPLVGHLAERLEPGGRLIIKDVDDAPWPKMAFTWLLDKLMDPRAPLDYWSCREVLAMLNDHELDAFAHAMIDVLPYPHMLYVAQRRRHGAE